MTSMRYIDDRSGQIVTSLLIHEIAHYEEYHGLAQAGEFVCRACKRPELDCSKDPCDTVRQERGEAGDEGTEGQDRDNYSDEQDRDSYEVTT